MRLKFSFLANTALCNAAGFQSSPPVCIGTAGFGIILPMKVRKWVANKGRWRTGLRVVALSRAGLPSSLHASSYGPALLFTTAVAAEEQS